MLVRIRLRGSVAALRGHRTARLFATFDPQFQAVMQEKERHISVLQQALKESISAGKLQSAEQLAAEAKAATIDLYGPNHPASASALNNEALVAKQKGDLPKALELYEAARQAYEKLQMKTHLSYAATLANIGLLYCAMASGAKGVEALGHADAAKSYLEHALHVREGELPAGNPLLSVTKYQLATALRLGKRYSQAETLLRTAVDELRQSVGDKHPSTGTALNNLGFLLKEMKKYAEAEQAYGEAIRIRTTALGENHQDTITAMHNLAECRRAAGNEDGAIEVQIQILELLKVYQPDKAPEHEAAIAEIQAARRNSTGASGA